MNSKQIGKWFIFGGLLLIAAALCLVTCNINEQTQAAQSSINALQQIESAKNENKTTDPDLKPGITVDEPEIPAYLRDPYMQMPELEIDGEMYIGVISIPALKLQLPVISEWSYPRLKISPCRFQGTPYLDDFIVLAHNYQSHFGTLVNLQLGDDVYFEDMDGNVFHYAVVEMETLDSTAIEDMVAGDWDLTLFTCTVGGKSRVTVRCEQTNAE